MSMSARPSLLLFAAALLAVLPACTPPRKYPVPTQLELREMQTRSYPSKNFHQIMKAVINALQDEGYMIRNADSSLGFISGMKEVDVEDSTQAFLQQLFNGPSASYPKNSSVECSINVSEFGKEVRVRAVFQTKLADNFGRPLETRQVDDPAFYTDFFSKVDKGIFLEREGV